MSCSRKQASSACLHSHPRGRHRGAQKQTGGPLSVSHNLTRKTGTKTPRQHNQRESSGLNTGLATWQQGGQGPKAMEGAAPHTATPPKHTPAIQGSKQMQTPLHNATAAANHTTRLPCDDLTDGTPPLLCSGCVFYPPRHTPPTPTLWPLILALKSCRQGQVDTPSRGGREIAELREGKHAPPHYLRGCGMQELLAEQCCHAQRLSRPLGASIKAGPAPLSLTHFS